MTHKLLIHQTSHRDQRMDENTYIHTYPCSEMMTPVSKIVSKPQSIPPGSSSRNKLLSHRVELRKRIRQIFDLTLVETPSTLPIWTGLSLILLGNLIGPTVGIWSRRIRWVERGGIGVRALIIIRTCRLRVGCWRRLNFDTSILSDGHDRTQRGESQTQVTSFADFCIKIKTKLRNRIEKNKTQRAKRERGMWIDTKPETYQWFSINDKKNPTLYQSATRATQQKSN